MEINSPPSNEVIDFCNSFKKSFKENGWPNSKIETWKMTPLQKFIKDTSSLKHNSNYLISNKKNLIKKSKVFLIMSHLSCADEKGSKLNKIQLRKFKQIIKYFPESMHSLSNSAGILLGKEFHFDMVRPGISLFGGHCQKNEKNIYKNVVTLKAKLIQVREIEKETI